MSKAIQLTGEPLKLRNDQFGSTAQASENVGVNSALRIACRPSFLATRPKRLCWSSLRSIAKPLLPCLSATVPIVVATMVPAAALPSQQQLTDKGLIGVGSDLVEDAKLQLGAAVRKEIAREIKGALRDKVLNDHGLKL
ncbi:hypothetical protein [Bradyrhizobium sp. USDA 3364]